MNGGAWESTHVGHSMELNLFVVVAAVVAS